MQLSFDDLPAESEPAAQARQADDLYVIGEGFPCGIVKIGRALNPKKRLGSIQTGYPRRLSILHAEEGAGELEEQVHDHFRAERLHGEWFDFGSREPVAEVKLILSLVRRRIAPLPPSPPSGGLKRSRRNLALIFAGSRAPDDFLHPVDVAAHMMALPTEELREWPVHGASIPWEWNGSDLVIRRRDLEEWARQPSEAAEAAAPAA